MSFFHKLYVIFFYRYNYFNYLNMSWKNALLEQECGGTNSLVELSNNFAQNNSKLQNQRNEAINSLLPSLSKGEEVCLQSHV